jgi:HAD superfamily hydrolase (TIGR01549 family)
MIRAIIFDFDGIILETAEVKTNAFRKLFAENYPSNLDEIIEYHKKNMGISRYVKFEYIYDTILKRPLSQSEKNELGDRFSKLVLTEVLESPFVPGTFEFLKNNCSQYSLFVVSGTPEEELNHIAKERKVADFFKLLRGSPGKKSDIIDQILRNHGWQPKEVVFVGDAESDLIAAKETGVFFVGRFNHETAEYIKPSGNIFLIDDLFQLKNVIDELNISEKAIKNEK